MEMPSTLSRVAEEDDNEADNANTLSVDPINVSNAVLATEYCTFEDNSENVVKVVEKRILSLVTLYIAAPTTESA
jgi:hypothetical protein